ncbi:hypothetical protein PVAND_000080 [Polypedilum vanderplanki]|uniref:Uncharacterized protein n=1 Tax=Polypedilum vanderplanki TaxID=319348 RepID=A0A9J6BJR4_POLVA|nr:hypothetical protein PVAND_000080 [Polypedilum vanderplanki]
MIGFLPLSLSLASKQASKQLRAKWRRERELRTQRRSVDHVSGNGGSGGENGNSNNNNNNNSANGNNGSNGSANVGNTNSVSPPVPTNTDERTAIQN